MGLFFERLPESGRNGYLHEVVNRHAEEIEGLRPAGSVNVFTGQRKDGVWREGLPVVEAARPTELQVVRFVLWQVFDEYLLCRRFSDLALGAEGEKFFVARSWELRKTSYPTGWTYPAGSKERTTTIGNISEYVDPPWVEQEGLAAGGKATEVFGAKVSPAIVVPDGSATVSCGYIDCNVDARRWRLKGRYYIGDTQVRQRTGLVRMSIWGTNPAP